MEDYPKWCLDEIDKILYNLFFETELDGVKAKPKEYTITQIKNHVFSRLITQVSKGLTLQQKLDDLIKAGILEGRVKDTQLQVFKSKK